jgi:NitT/TauT family transport system permease protein
MKFSISDFRKRKLLENASGLATSIFVFVALFALWEYASRTELVDPMFSSAPSKVIVTGWELLLDGTLLKHAKASGRVFLIGFSAAVLLGVPIGVALGWLRWVNRAFSPLVSAFYTMPRIALMPLFIIWFGLGM